MAKLEFSIAAHEVANLIAERKDHAARAKARDLLLDGENHPHFLRVVASLLTKPVRGVGSPKHPPPNWYNIARRYYELRDEGHTHESAVISIAEARDPQCSGSESSIKRAVKHFQAGMTE